MEAYQIINDTLPRPPQIQHDAVTDALSTFLVACEKAHRTWARHQISRHLALMAEVADPRLRRDIQAEFHTGTLTEPELAWAHAIRTRALHQRAERARPLLNALDQLRKTQAIEATATLKAPEQAKTVQTSDRHQWWTHCQQWLENNEHPHHLVDRWRQANTHLNTSLNGNTTTITIAPLPHPPWHHDSQTPPDPGLCPTAPKTNLPTVARTQVDEATAALAHMRRAEARKRLPHRPAPPGDHHLRNVLDSAADWYHKQLLYSPHAEPARQYLLQRGLTPQDWKNWKLGWGGNTWRGACNTIKNDRLALEAGVAATSQKGTIYDRMRKRIVFPIRNPQGQTIAFAGRTITDREPKYLNTPGTALYHKSEILYGLDNVADTLDAGGHAIMVEGYLDVIAAQKAGLPAVAPCGTAATGHHLSQLEAAGADHLTVCFDGDQAGTRSAIHKVALPAFRQALSVAIAQLPAGTDPASITPTQLRQAISEAKALPWAVIADALQQEITSERGRWIPIHSAVEVDRTIRENLPIEQNSSWTHPDHTFPHLTNLVTAHLLASTIDTNTNLFLNEQHRHHTSQPQQQRPDTTPERARIRTI